MDLSVHYRPCMPRPELHSVDGILDSARDLVLEGGARAATIDGIVAASGAPKGSIYHRFPTLNDLLAEMWLRSVKRSQGTFLAALDEPDPQEAAVGAALSVYDFSEADPADAQLLAALRREDLLGSVTSAEAKRALENVNKEMREGVLDLARRLYGRASEATVEKTTFAVIDLPQGAIRRHLVARRALPKSLRDQLEAATRAAL